MISNPAKFFVTGSKEKWFTYEGGDKLFHFSPNDNNLSTYMDCNIILFANDEKHGLSILHDMFQFAIDCKREYIKYKTGNKVSYSDEELIEYAEHDVKDFIKYRDAIKAGKVKLTLAPKNQIYKVGWADNDDI